MSRVTEIRYVGYGVEDFATERKFYAEDWGLVEVEATEDMLGSRPTDMTSTTLSGCTSAIPIASK